MDIKLAGSWNNSPLPSIPSLPSLPPSTLKHPLHPMRDPNPHLLPTQPGTLATPCTLSQRSGCWGDPAVAQHLSSGGHSCLLMQVAWDARLACEAAAGAGSITAAGGGPFPWPFSGNVFLAHSGSLTLETLNPLVQGPWVQPPLGPTLAPQPAACAELGHAGPEQPG